MPKPQRKLVRIQQRGQITLPAEIRRKVGLKPGDLVSIEDTAEGVIIKPQRGVPAEVVARNGQTLAEQGVSLDELLVPEQDARTPAGYPLRQYTMGEIEQFLKDDRLSKEQLAIVRRFQRSKHASSS